MLNCKTTTQDPFPRVSPNSHKIQFLDAEHSMPQNKNKKYKVWARNRKGMEGIGKTSLSTWRLWVSGASLGANWKAEVGKGTHLGWGC